MLASRVPVSVAWDERLDSLLVTVEAQDQEVGEILSIVARCAGVQVTVSGSNYFLGAVRPEDKGVLVRRVLRLDVEGIRGCVSCLLSESGKIQAFSDGLLVVGDRVEVLSRLNDLLDQVEGAPSATWVVQVLWVGVSRQKLRELGLDQSPTLTLAANFALSSAAGPAGAATATEALSSLVRASWQDDGVEVFADPLLLCMDGSKVSYVRGQQVPVPQSVVSDQGTVSTAGYTIIQTGFQLHLAVRECGVGAARCSVDVSDSSVSTYVAAAPVVNSEAANFDVVVKSGGAYLLGSLRRVQKREHVGISNLFGFRREIDDQAGEVWLRCYRVGGPLTDAEHQEAAGSESFEILDNVSSGGGN